MKITFFTLLLLGSMSLLSCSKDSKTTIVQQETHDKQQESSDEKLSKLILKSNQKQRELNDLEDLFDQPQLLLEEEIFSKRKIYQQTYLDLKEIQREIRKIDVNYKTQHQGTEVLNSLYSIFQSIDSKTIQLSKGIRLLTQTKKTTDNFSSHLIIEQRNRDEIIQHLQQSREIIQFMLSDQHIYLTQQEKEKINEQSKFLTEINNIFSTYIHQQRNIGTRLSELKKINYREEDDNHNVFLALELEQKFFNLLTNTEAELKTIISSKLQLHYPDEIQHYQKIYESISQGLDSLADLKLEQKAIKELESKLISLGYQFSDDFSPTQLSWKKKDVYIHPSKPQKVPWTPELIRVGLRPQFQGTTDLSIIIDDENYFYRRIDKSSFDLWDQTFFRLYEHLDLYLRKYKSLLSKNKYDTYWAKAALLDSTYTHIVKKL